MMRLGLGRLHRVLFALLLAPVLALGADDLAVKAESAVVMDAQSGKVLWSKMPDAERFPASTTKIMTALLMIEKCKPDEVFVVPSDMAPVDGASLHLKPGETFAFHDMLTAVLLRSANDACEIVAKHIAGDIPKFAELMNERAKQLGCEHTHFHNPHGLVDPLHTISARDLALIAREAMKYPEFRQIVRRRRAVIQRSINQQDCVMVSHNKYLEKDLTADGIKTGFTKPAGHCYVGSASRGGVRIITVILKDDDWALDQAALLDYGFKSFDRRVVAKTGKTKLTANVVGGTVSSIEVAPAQDIVSVQKKSDISPPTPTIEIAAISAPIEKGQQVGFMSYRDSDGFEQKVPLVALESVSARTLASKSGLGLIALGGGGLMAAGILVRTGKRRRPRINGKARA